jgi:polysaccharide chain length determinant protein (PEP-CTERM system associated)
MATKSRRSSSADHQSFPLLGILKRRWHWGLLAAAAVLVPAVSVIAFLPDVYRSKATVLIERQQIPDVLVRSTVTSALETRLHTITQEILSRPSLETLASQFGVGGEWGGPSTPEVAIAQIRRSIDVELETSKVGRDYSATAVAFTVAYSSRDAERAAKVANALAQSYVEKNLAMRREEAAGTAEFLRDQLSQTAARLQAQEKQVSAFKEKHTGQLPEQLNANLATLEQLNVQLRLNSENQISARERRAALVKQLGEVEGMAPAVAPDAAGNRLLQLRQTLATLQARYSDKYPDVVRVKAEIAALESQLRRSGDDSKPGMIDANPMTFELRRSIDSVDVELTRLKAEQENLHRSIAEYQQRVEMAPRREQEAQSLTRDYDTTKDLYKSLVNRERESQLAEDMEQRRKGEQFRIIEPALAPRSPSAPNRRLLIPLVLPFSLAFGFAAMLARELTDKSVRSSDEVAALAPIRIVARIPAITGPEWQSERRRRLKLVVGAAAGAAVIVIGVSYVFARGNWGLTNLLLRFSS